VTGILSLETFTTITGVEQRTLHENALKRPGGIRDNNFLFQSKIYSYVSNILKLQIKYHNLLIHFSTGPLPFRETL
jgi:hypothetical protein